MQNKRMWPFHEISTRNCVHAKVVTIKGQPRVICDLRKPLTNHDYTSLKTVNITARFVSSNCGRCLEFEHDVEAR